MTIINRSEVLGLPLAAMLSRMAGATVYSVDVDSVLWFRLDGRVRRVSASSASAVEWCVGMLTAIVSGVPSASFRRNVSKYTSQYDMGNITVVVYVMGISHHNKDRRFSGGSTKLGSVGAS
jgi:hypothetical protein